MGREGSELCAPRARDRWDETSPLEGGFTRFPMIWKRCALVSSHETFALSPQMLSLSSNHAKILFSYMSSYLMSHEMAITGCHSYR